MSDVKINISAKDDASRVLSQVRSSLNEVNSVASRVGSALGFVSGITVGSMVAMVKASIDAGDEMNDLSQRVGISVTELAKYQLAASQSGTTMEALAKGIKGLSVNLMEHGESLKAAGINATTADAAMIQMADIFAAMPDGMEKTTLAVKVFGKSGMDLIPMLNLGAEGLKTAAEKSEKFAKQMALMAPLADVFNDNMSEISMATKVAFMETMNSALPAMVLVSKSMAETAQKAGLLKVAMTGLQEIWAKGWGYDIDIQRLKMSAWLDEIQAKKKGFFGNSDKEASAYQNSANEKYLKIQQLAANDPRRRPVPDAPKVANDSTANDWKSKYDKLMAAMGGMGSNKGDAKEKQSEASKYLESLQKQLEKAEELNAVQTLGMEINAGRVGKMTIEEQQGLVIAALKVDTSKKEIETQKELVKATTAAQESSDRSAKSYLQSVISGEEALKNSNTSLLQHIQEIGLTKEALSALELARIDDSIATEQQTLAILNSQSGQEVEVMLLQRRIDLLKEKRALTAGGQIAQAAADTAQEQDAASKKYAETLQSDVKGALSNAFRDTKDPLASFGDALGNVVYTRISNALADSMTNTLFNSSGGNGMAALFKMFSFDGGGYTGSGSRAGGLDGKGGFMAMLHPQETVVDHSKGQNSGSPVTVVNHINYTVGDVASVSMVKMAVANSERRTASVIGRSMTYGGSLS